MGDGTTRSLADIRAGDVVYGTVLRGKYRRYARTPVLAHWQTLKKAFRVTLEDGTALVASAIIGSSPSAVGNTSPDGPVERAGART